MDVIECILLIKHQTHLVIFLIRPREDDWKSMARTRLRKFEEELHSAFENGMNSYSGMTTWNFVNSVLYCLTAVTTIGNIESNFFCNIGLQFNTMFICNCFQAMDIFHRLRRSGDSSQLFIPSLVSQFSLYCWLILVKFLHVLSSTFGCM